MDWQMKRKYVNTLQVATGKLQNNRKVKCVQSKEALFPCQLQTILQFQALTHCLNGYAKPSTIPTEAYSCSWKVGQCTETRINTQEVILTE